MTAVSASDLFQRFPAPADFAEQQLRDIVAALRTQGDTEGIYALIQLGRELVTRQIQADRRQLHEQ